MTNLEALQLFLGFIGTGMFLGLVWVLLFSLPKWK